MAKLKKGAKMKTSLLICIILSSISIIIAQERTTNTFQNSFFDVNQFSNPMIGISVLTTNVQNNYYLFSSYSINENITFSGEFIDAGNSQLIIAASYLILNGNSKLAIGPALAFRDGYIGALSAFKIKIFDKLESVSKLGFFFKNMDLTITTLSSSLISYVSDDLNIIGEVSYSNEGLLELYSHDHILIGNIGAGYQIFQRLVLRGSIGYNFFAPKTDLIFLSGLSYYF
jgi:hypothetical protein